MAVINNFMTREKKLSLISLSFIFTLNKNIYYVGHEDCFVMLVARGTS